MTWLMMSQRWAHFPGEKRRATFSGKDLIVLLQESKLFVSSSCFRNEKRKRDLKRVVVKSGKGNSLYKPSPPLPFFFSSNDRPCHYSTFPFSALPNTVMMDRKDPREQSSLHFSYSLVLSDRRESVWIEERASVQGRACQYCD